MTGELYKNGQSENKRGYNWKGTCGKRKEERYMMAMKGREMWKSRCVVC